MSRNSIPATRVISPSPTPSERGSGSQDDGYFGPVTRSSKKKRATTPIIDEGIDEEDDINPDLRRARSKSRSPIRLRKMGGLTPAKPTTSTVAKSEPLTLNGQTNGQTNGHLSPATAAKSTGWSWRDISRSPSPLGLIPIHRQWRVFIHRHEVPRKVLHVSIGFFTLWAYASGIQPSAITPWLIGCLIPIAATDYLRFKLPPLNRVYVRVWGAFMRETEYDNWNGVIWYLLGVSIVLNFPKDVGVVSVLLLSFCDTAASTFGRAYGRYTPRIRKGKSLAGSAAAFAVGVLTAYLFYGVIAPRVGPFATDIDFPFMYNGILRLPAAIQNAIGLTEAQSVVTGGLALAILSLWTGFIASASEVANVHGLDDNLTIPVLSGIGLWVFLRVFG